MSIIIITKDFAVSEEEFLDLITNHPSVAKLSAATGCSAHAIKQCVLKYFPNKRKGALGTILELYGKARCNVCKLAKPRSDFGISNKLPSGLCPKCKICSRKSSKKYMDSGDNREKQKLVTKEYYAANKSQFQEYFKEYNITNAEQVAAQKKAWQQSDIGRSKTNATNAKYKASKLKRTPVWAELEQIQEFYMNCPEGYHVDHIIPLQGGKVSGFHVLGNLQYLTASENISKSNSYEV
jgi:hypothetical protein